VVNQIQFMNVSYLGLSADELITRYGTRRLGAALSVVKSRTDA
jgi:hypothetical protein